MTTKQKPVREFRLFRKSDLWNESTRFHRDDIPLVQLALDEAHTWIFQNREENS